MSPLAVQISTSVRSRCRSRHCRSLCPNGHPSRRHPQQRPSLHPRRPSETIETINGSRKRSIKTYVQTDAPQYRILHEIFERVHRQASPATLAQRNGDRSPPRTLQSRSEDEAGGSRIIKEAEKVDDYDDYQKRLSASWNSTTSSGLQL